MNIGYSRAKQENSGEDSVVIAWYIATNAYVGSI